MSSEQPTPPHPTEGSTAAVAVLLLHGHGDDPGAFDASGPQLLAASPAGAALLRPRAPHRIEGLDGAAWWAPDEEGPSETTVTALVHALDTATGARPRPTFVVIGFSQGAAVALSVAAAVGRHRPDAVLRVAVVAGFVPGDGSTPPAGSDVLVVHGRNDDVVDPFHGALIARRCRRGGCTVHEHDHDGDHRWDDEVTDTVRRWLSG